MANITTTAKASLLRNAIYKATGAYPELELKDGYARIYFAPDELKKAQNWFKKSIEKEPGIIRFDISPVITPYYIKKILPYAIVSALLFYFLGKM